MASGNGCFSLLMSSCERHSRSAWVLKAGLDREMYNVQRGFFVELQAETWLLAKRPLELADCGPNPQLEASQPSTLRWRWLALEVPLLTSGSSGKYSIKAK